MFSILSFFFFFLYYETGIPTTLCTSLLLCTIFIMNFRKISLEDCGSKGVLLFSFFWQDLINQSKQSSLLLPQSDQIWSSDFLHSMFFCQKILPTSLWMDNTNSFISSKFILVWCSILDKTPGYIHSLKTTHPFLSTKILNYTSILVYFLD